MSDPMQHINALTAEVTALLDLVTDHFNGLDERYLTYEGQYLALAGDLQLVATNTLHYVATVDPDTADPTRVAGGTFLSLAEVFAAAPPGCHLRIGLAAGKSHVHDSNVATDGRDVSFAPFGQGADPVLDVRHIEVIENGAPRRTPAGIIMDFGGSVRFDGIAIQFEGLANDEAWSQERRGLVRGDRAAKINASFVACSALATDAEALVDVWGGCSADVTLVGATLDATFVVRGNSAGSAVVTKQSVTFLNGAAVAGSLTNVTDH